MLRRARQPIVVVSQASGTIYPFDLEPDRRGRWPPQKEFWGTEGKVQMSLFTLVLVTWF
jgi:hypothetical protein